MGEKRLGQGSFAEVFWAPGVGINRRLARIEELVDWDRLEGLLRRSRKAGGRPGYPALSLFKALVLQQWYGLSDPGLEEALMDRLSFRRFCGFSLADATPDETTFVRFRAVLREHGLTGRLFAELNRQFEALGLIVKAGTLIDASLIEANADVRKGADGAPVTADPEAGFARSRGKAFFGYKAHIGVDEGSGLVRRVLMTPAGVHDTLVGDSLICWDEGAVWADKAYDTHARRGRLAAAGIVDGIMHPRRRGQTALRRWQAEWNRHITPIRSAVERIFGTLKRSYGYRRVRYRGLARNQAHLHLLVIALNLRRAERLLA